MHWVALGVVCIALIFVSYYSPKVGFGLLGALAVILTSLYFLNLDESESQKFPVARESVELSEIQAEKSYGESWDYAGRVTNSSDKAITDVQIRVVLYDCPSGASARTDACVIICYQIDYVPINISPRQARDFTDNISFRHAEPKGSPFWAFELAGLRVAD